MNILGNWKRRNDWKACPFCGSTRVGNLPFEVRCLDCGAQAPESEWNKRCPELPEDFARSCLLLLTEMHISVVSEPDQRTILVPEIIAVDTKNWATAIQAILVGVDKILGLGQVEAILENVNKETSS